MKLFVTANSPYARMPRILLLEKPLGDRLEILEAQTRVPESPYYRINPSGRVPFLLTDEGQGLEEASLICRYLDQLDGKPLLDWPAIGLDGDGGGWDARRLEASAQSLLAGLAVWTRELYRPGGERSPGVIDHERARCQRLADLWEQQVALSWMSGRLNLAQIVLICALQLERRNPDIDWRPGRPGLRSPPRCRSRSPDRPFEGPGGDLPVQQ